MHKHVDWSKKPKVVSLQGKESFFKDREIDRAIQHLPSHHVVKYEGGTDDDDIRSSLTAGRSPFVDMDEKLIVIRKADQVDDKSMLESYCDNPADDRIVVLVEKSKGRTAKWFKNLKVSKRLEFEEIPEWELGSWLTEEAQARGYRLSKQYAEAIVLNVGTNLYALSNELDKLAVYCEDKKEIETDDISAVLFEHSALSPFKIIRHWGVGNQKMALQFFTRHFEKTPKPEWTRSELVLLNGFQNRIQNLIQARSMRDSGSTDRQIAQALGKSKWLYQNKIADQVKNRRVSALVDSYGDLCEIEERIKQGDSGYLLLQSFLIRH